nr:uncharacterized protein LOC106683540 [Halyomorpha halys]
MENGNILCSSRSISMKYNALDGYPLDLSPYIENYNASDILNIETPTSKGPIKVQQYFASVSSAFPPYKDKLTDSPNNSSDSEISKVDPIIDALDDFEAETISKHKHELLKICKTPVAPGSMKQYLNSMLLDINRGGVENCSNATGYYSEFFGVKKPLYCYGSFDPPLYKAKYCSSVSDSDFEEPIKVDIVNLIHSFETGKAFQNEFEGKDNKRNKINEIFEEVAKIKENEKAYLKSDSIKYFEQDKDDDLDYNIIIPPPPEFQNSDSYHGTPISDPSVSSNTISSTLSSLKLCSSYINTIRSDFTDDSEDSIKGR